jgi:hypothetical protein
LPARSKSTKSTSQAVKYTGTADDKVITKADWKAIDIDDQDTVTWSWRNDWAVPVDQFTEEALNYCKNVDGALKIIDVEASD